MPVDIHFPIYDRACRMYILQALFFIILFEKSGEEAFYVLVVRLVGLFFYHLAA